EADSARTDLLHSLQTGSYVAPSKITVGEFLLKWLEHYARPSVSAKTFVRYEEIVNGRLIRDLGSIPLRKLTPSHILAARTRWASEKQRNRKPLSSQTLLHYHRVLYAALDRALKWQELAVNRAPAV